MLLKTVQISCLEVADTAYLMVLTSSLSSLFDELDWKDLAQDMDKWHALMNMIVNFRVP
jgi:hypothetical protein